MERPHDIRMEILSQRRRRVEREGPALGTEIPAMRRQMVVPVAERLNTPFVICEIKRSSPSRGEISMQLDPAELAQRYRDQGAAAVSVLTEEDHFHGSLQDLVAVKEYLRETAVLRKDFLYCREDIEISYRAGADMILLIASLLESPLLEELYHLTLDFGMMPLVEVHDTDDIEKVRGFAPVLTGINSRDLRNFTIDRLLPVRLAQAIDWPTSLVYESGIRTREDAEFAGRHGFRALLVGEHAVRNPGIIGDLITGLDIGSDLFNTRRHTDFWSHLTRRQTGRRPLVKICGITSRDDAQLAVDLGADVIGCVLADSPRRAGIELFDDLAGLDIPVCAVVVDLHTDKGLYEQLVACWRRGVLDAVQFHGDEPPEFCEAAPFPWYRAVRPRSVGETAQLDVWSCPRVLIDAFSSSAGGGTGRRVSEEIVRAAGQAAPLWLAGGITPENAAELVRRFTPELIDLSSGVERSAGVKDPEKMRALFNRLEDIYGTKE